MKKFWFMLLALGLALNLGAFACSSDDDDNDDGSTDGDSDSDTDGDSDTDADSDSDADCGTLDDYCCPAEPGPACESDYICVGISQTDPDETYCLAPCTPSVCTNINEQQGNCQDLGPFGVCITPGDLTPVTCTIGNQGCTTPSGATTGTVCVGDGTNTYCLEMCTATADECDDSHTCVGLTSGGGACLPNE
jgi:hypothetical protein